MEFLSKIPRAMSTGAWVLLMGYGVCLGVLVFYGFHRFLVVSRYRRYYVGRGRTDIAPAGRWEERDLPSVTVQIPCYNEMYVIDRLIDAVAAIDYPRDRLEVQIVDDSTDETTTIALSKIDFWRPHGLDIALLRRSDRSGFKAGALAAGLTRAKGEFIAIFDADFVPQPGFLRETIHHFTDPAVGVVQSRWTHLNRGYSLLTEVQSIVLDAHHQLEQTARCYAGCFFSFNGTGGIWRRRAIEEAGGWEHDTLTEDTDLSYRAQLRGWRFVYLPKVTSPAELPVDIQAYRTQQHRWIVGTLQCARKHLGGVWRAHDLSLRTKVEATYQLTANLAYLFSFLLALLSGPLLFLDSHIRWLAAALIDAPLFCIAFVSIFRYYIEAQRELFPNEWIRRAPYVAYVSVVFAGVAPANASAVLVGLFSNTSEFVRTAKYGLTGGHGTWRSKQYATRGKVPVLEVAVGLYFLCCSALALRWGRFVALPFDLLFAFGSFYVAYLIQQGAEASREERGPSGQPEPAEQSLLPPPDVAMYAALPDEEHALKVASRPRKVLD
jgi:cellulose synthase/poly-beta-1,6-N-acetylglucosamine synthase-like glycosyltransferase